MGRNQVSDEDNFRIRHLAAAVLQNDVHGPQLSTGSCGTQDVFDLFFQNFGLTGRQSGAA